MAALIREYVDGEDGAMGHAMDSGLNLRGSEEDYADELERRVRRARPRNAEGFRAEIEVIRAELVAAAAQGGPPPQGGGGGGHDSDSGGSSDDSDPGDLKGSTVLQLEARRDSHVGGCVLAQPARECGLDAAALRAPCLEVSATEEFERFPKVVTAGGVNYIGAEGTTDAFLLAVAGITCELFAEAEHIDPAKQLAVMQACHRHQATCPVSVGGDHRAVEPSLHTEAYYSVCDRIGEGVKGQAMEVLEHVLHHVTDVGFHYAFPEEWGLRQVNI